MRLYRRHAATRDERASAPPPSPDRTLLLYHHCCLSAAVLSTVGAAAVAAADTRYPSCNILSPFCVVLFVPKTSHVAANIAVFHVAIRGSALLLSRSHAFTADTEAC